MIEEEEDNDGYCKCCGSCGHYGYRSLCSSEVLMPKPASYAWTGLVGYVIVADVVELS